MAEIDSQLMYALELDEDEREKTLDLDTGFDAADNTWELIVKVSSPEEFPSYVSNVNVLSDGFVTLKIKQSDIDRLMSEKGIDYIEKPKRLYYEINNGKRASCITQVQVQNSDLDLSGAGTIVAIIDSGIDYSHPAFLDAFGQTRLIGLWDQTGVWNGEYADEWVDVTGGLPTPPQGYANGILYPQEWINYVLTKSAPTRMRMLPEVDISGHGTAVAGIACGSGTGGGSSLRGVAYGAQILFVKLGQSTGDSFPRTTRLMEAINWVSDVAISMGRPIAINLSFGNNYGAHNGRSLLESYIDDAANRGRNSIVIGTGNEGSSRLHFEGMLSKTYGEEIVAEFNISLTQTSLNIQIWKNYFDISNTFLELPDGRRYEIVNRQERRAGEQIYTEIFNYGNTNIYVFNSTPTPYNELEEIYIEFIRGAESTYIEGGRYRIVMRSVNVVDGRVNMWMPSGQVVSPGTGFLLPSPYTSLTIPSTAYRAVSVAAYDTGTDAAADYSGRGFLINGLVKPDIAAPGTNITAPAPNGSYSVNTGTSMAAPFVTGSASLLMEWGIVRGNDTNMYGEKLKAALIMGARRDSGLDGAEYPNQRTGWGRLCVANIFQNI